ncbi:MICOS complex subunit MIC19-like isoform X7 [Sinocyclocheilus rhinocerous]|uniref:MICOS complex subunit MIC19-like isoform X7 n=1 Tax=Sinocyclocheilus rhinocerous TaxID=307959 RepID=UPI0007B98267|nr:PREDICTED: MICOS complex subunit MIC19-like isoform X7 [Sinocyclocheilus rhinocerous]
MGANYSTRRVSFESDENENITIVKGIRLSEKVIDRMREPSGPPRPPTRTPPAPPPVVDPLPALVPISPPPDPVTSLPPSSLPERVKLPEQVTTTAPPPPLAEPVILPPPPPESVGAVSAPAVHESELRRKIAEELQKGLEEERRKAREELNQRLEKEKSQAHVQAQAEAQAQVKDEVSRILALEKEQSIQKAILRERITAEDERLQAPIYARQLEERDKALRKQDAFYREQVAKLKERSAQFYKVTDENYHKAADEVNAKFKSGRLTSSPR